MSATSSFDDKPVLTYLGLPPSYEPSPRHAPIEFLKRHVRELPPHLLSLFSSITTPRERTTIPAIRNRRLKFTESNPAELSLANAKATWPALWEGRERPGQEQGRRRRIGPRRSSWVVVASSRSGSSASCWQSTRKSESRSVSGLSGGSAQSTLSRCPRRMRTVTMKKMNCLSLTRCLRPRTRSMSSVW
ncbi:hypothetical protein C8T65DRAFT_188459 [Cerioporus squamosus]|nr:hypothetical protein C8T65DRAFT_188459 [Cerioporus squamosus]